MSTGWADEEGESGLDIVWGLVVGSSVGFNAEWEWEVKSVNKSEIKGISDCGYMNSWEAEVC